MGRKAAERRAGKEARRAQRTASLSSTGPISTPMVVGIFALLIVGGIAALLVVGRGVGRSNSVIDPNQVNDHKVGESVPLERALHLAAGQPGSWATDPPTSGAHWNITGTAPSKYGVYADPVPPEAWLHNLEHGGVVILYLCPNSSCKQVQKDLKSFLRGEPYESRFGQVRLLATQYPLSSHRYALIAWGWRQFMDGWDRDTAERFYQAHVDQGPESAP
ncbi:MAG: DUF3105 domain-containing protein [Candidatus Dormibacteria bacterium]